MGEPKEIWSYCKVAVVLRMHAHCAFLTVPPPPVMFFLGSFRLTIGYNLLVPFKLMCREEAMNSSLIKLFSDSLRKHIYLMKNTELSLYPADFTVHN